MSLTTQALTLGADPRSVQEARRWVAAACQEMGRQDLLECAELGVSELVTNALLHADDPIIVRVRGTTDHPRVEVSDGSREPPVVPLQPTEDDLLSTFGRGLSIVAQGSIAWGAAIENGGKVVWFEPATAPQVGAMVDGAVFDMSEETLTLEPGGDLVRVLLAAIPVPTMLGVRQHYNELRREVRLLSLAHSDHYPVAQDLTDVFTSFEQAFPITATHQVDAAHAAGEHSVDLDVLVRPQDGPTFERMSQLLDLADEFCRAERLLALERTPEQAGFQRWFLDEFARQARGEEPRSWQAVDEPPSRSARIVS
ncbi:MAG: ATP-binding protein [Nocardioides sp.]